MDAKEFVRHAEDGNFENMVLKSDKPVLVDFWAPWCGPCRALAPILEELAKEYADSVHIVKVNVDENPETSLLYDVRSIPTLLLIKNGKVGHTQIGLLPKNKLAALIDKNLN
ncbi:MAG: thioredoxin [Syntrophaceae bacterium]|nr:thioredoxin [Syntrophaceae bacterium]